MEGTNRSNLESLAQRLKASGKRVTWLSYDIVTQFFDYRENIVEPAIEDLRAQIDQIVKSKISYEYLQTPRGSGWSMAGIRYVVVVRADDGSDHTRCEIEFSASDGENFIRVRAARDALSNGGAKEVHLYPRQFSTETVQRVFSHLLVECVVDDHAEDAAVRIPKTGAVAP